MEEQNCNMNPIKPEEMKMNVEQYVYDLVCKLNNVINAKTKGRDFYSAELKGEFNSIDVPDLNIKLEKIYHNAGWYNVRCNIHYDRLELIVHRFKTEHEGEISYEMYSELKGELDHLIYNLSQRNLFVNVNVELKNGMKNVHTLAEEVATEYTNVDLSVDYLKDVILHYLKTSNYANYF